MSSSDPHSNSENLVIFFRCVYNIWIEAQHSSDVLAPDPQKVQVLVPGSPDAPHIWTRSVDREEFVIEWGEPRLWGTKLDGYQVKIHKYFKMKEQNQ